MLEPDALLLLPRIRIQNADAISSPLTWGFPSPTAFCGFAHALHRKLSSEFRVALEGTVIVCHAIEPQVSTPAGRRTKVFSLTRNPVNERGGSAALIEEGRTHLDVSLVIGMTGEDLFGAIDRETIAARASELTQTMRIAGGSILPNRGPPSAGNQATIVDCAFGPDDPTTRTLVRRLLPGFALVSREALLDAHWATLKLAQPHATMLDALLDLTRVNVEPPEEHHGADEAAASTEWHLRSRPGWLVPIPVGFGALSDLHPPGQVKNARDHTSPFRFVEGLLSAGQWLSPHRIQDIRHALWRQQFDSSNGIYRCTTPHFAGEV